MKKTKLGDVCDLSIGFVGTVTTQYEEGGIPFFRTLNIKPYKIDDSDLKRITKKFHESQRKSQLFKDDIIMVHTGVPGICCVIDDKYNNSNCIDAIVIKPHKDEIDSHFLEAYMNTIGYKHIEKQQVGCVQKHFNLKDAVELSIFIPSIEKQKKIGKLAFDINKQIEINNQINSELESMAKTIYDYWFLQFEFPNEEGKPYKSSGGKMVWNDELKREIPEGWEVEPILDFCSWEGTSQPPKSTFVYEPKEGYVRFIQNRDYEDDTSYPTYIPLKGNTPVCDERDILMDKYGDAGRVRFGLNGAYNVALSKIVVKNKNFREYIRSFFESDSTYNYLHNSSMASTRASLNENNISYLYLPVPPKYLIDEYNKIANLRIETALKTRKENKELASLRDFLLPMLMNGQVTFKKN